MICGALIASLGAQPAFQSKSLILLDGKTVEAPDLRIMAASPEGSDAPQIHFAYTSGSDAKQAALETVFAVNTLPWNSLTITSDGSVQALSLGKMSLGKAAPDQWVSMPTDAAASWRPAIATVNARCMYYLPEAYWIWPSAGSEGKPRHERALFHKTFQIPESASISQARISLAGCHEISGLYFNGKKINYDADLLCGQIVSYDVADSLKPGHNIIALDIIAPEDVSHGYGGVSFRLDIKIAQNGGGSPSINHNCALVLSTNDVIKGDLIDITAKHFTIRHAGGTTHIGREWVDSAQFAGNGDKADNPVNPSLSDKGPCGFHTSNFSSARMAADTSMPARIVDRQGRVNTGDLLALDSKNRLIIEHEKDMPPMMMDIDSVQEINFINPQRFQLCQLKPSDFGRVARLHTIDGNAWHGLIANANDKSLFIETPYAGMMEFPLPIVARIVFPYQALAAAQKAAPTRPAGEPAPVIAIIGDLDPVPGSCARSLASSIQILGTALGYEVRELKAADLLNPQSMSPERLRLIINMDAKQRSYDGWEAANDVKNALVNYIEQGGNLLHLASGTPFYMGVQRTSEGEWAIKSCADSFNSKFGLHVAFPGEDFKEGMCIERPSNEAKRMTFTNVSASTLPYPMPGVIEFNSSLDTKFRPVAAAETGRQAKDTFTPLFHLKSDSGDNYGCAAALSQMANKNGTTSTVAYVAFPLAKSEWDNVPAVNFIFPWLMATIDK